MAVDRQYWPSLCHWKVGKRKCKAGLDENETFPSSVESFRNEKILRLNFGDSEFQSLKFLHRMRLNYFTFSSRVALPREALTGISSLPRTCCGQAAHFFFALKLLADLLALLFMAKIESAKKRKNSNAGILPEFRRQSAPRAHCVRVSESHRL